MARQKRIPVTTTVTIDLATAAKIDERQTLEGSRSAAIREIVGRYDQAMRRSLPELTPGEWQLLRDVLNGVWLRDSGDALGMIVSGIGHEVADGCRLDGLDRKWSEWAQNHGHPPVIGSALAAKVDALPWASKLAIIDSVERWWNREDAGAEAAP